MKISIVTPSFNQGEFIERTIQSVLAQQLGPYELEYVVMDGGSTDQTVRILRKYEHRLQWQSESDRGQSHAVNKAIQATSGEIIGWLNSDDLYYPDAIKQVCDFFQQHPEISVVYGDAHFIDRHDHYISDYPTESWNLDHLKSRCFISQPATFFRRSVVQQQGYLDEQLNFCMDYEYWLRLGLAAVKFAYLPKVLAASRMYAETKTSSGYLQANHEAIDMLKRHLHYVPVEWVVSKAGATVKAKYGFSYPHPRFVVATWWHLWQAAGQYYQGLTRIKVWLASQHAMLQKFLRRAFYLR